VGITTATAIVAGNDSACALLADKTVQCWGYNSYGTTGDGTTTGKHTTPNPVVSIDGTGTLGNVTQISMGYDHVCGVRGDGSVVCWGYNSYGELGDGTTTNSGTPKVVTGLTTSTIVSGKYHNCAMSSTGSVVCWGQNSSGQCGDGTTTSPRKAPVSVTF
jgi:alpha-tubulin suppressor-like RCC1 family protein